MSLEVPCDIVGGGQFFNICSVDSNKRSIWVLGILNNGISSGSCKDVFEIHYGWKKERV